MQLQVSFMTLLAGIFVVLSSTHGPVNAFPLSERETKGLVTLSLTRLPQRSNGVHPQIRLQQSINRQRRRLARMTGQEPPSKRELEDELRRRIISLQGPEGLHKHYNRTTAQAGGSGLSARDDPETVTPAGPPSVTNSLGLDIEGRDRGYIITVQMGTPSQDFRLLVDSSVSDTWVGGENCQSEGGGGCGNHTFLGSDSSRTFVDTGIPFALSVGAGDVSGNLVSDNIAIAGLQLSKHVFGIATMETVGFSDDSVPYDGVMGLGLPSASFQITLTPIEALVAQGLIKDPVVSYKLSRLADNKNDGEITFGGVDVNKFDPATVVPLPNVNQRGFWEAPMDSVSINDKDLGFQNRSAIMDTGTTSLFVPTDDAKTLHAEIPGSHSDGQGGFTFPCNTTAQIALTFGGTSFDIDPQDINFGPVDFNDPTGDCVSGISAFDGLGTGSWTLGTTFLKNAYFSTDLRNNNMSLAQLI